MSTSEEQLTRYLLGQLPEEEQIALEKDYFNDSNVLDKLIETENALIDSYVRGGLSPEVRDQIQRLYLSHPDRQSRVRFAEALAERLKTEERSGPAIQQVSGRGHVRNWFQGPWPVLRIAGGFAVLLILSASVWFYVETRRLRRELASAEAAKVLEEQRESDLSKKVDEEKAKLDKYAEEQEKLEKLIAGPLPAPSPSNKQTSVFLALTVGASRGAEKTAPATLRILRDTSEARVVLNLRENDYQAYRVVVQKIGGGEILNRPGLKATGRQAHFSLSLNIAANKFSSGDYVLTLKGSIASGEEEDVSKLIFRVEKK